MEYNNKFIEIAKKEGGIDKENAETIAVLLFLHLHLILQRRYGGEQLGHDEAQMKDDEIEVPVQINGKTKSRDQYRSRYLQRRSDCSRKKKRLQIN